MKPNWNITRKEPYTKIGIGRLKCIRCGKPAIFQWQICSDNNNFRSVCASCDIALNEVVLSFFQHPRKEELIAKYKLTARGRALKG
jgi:hypothetical protein